MKINLASGQRPFKKPWLNLDIRDQGYKVDIIGDIRKLDKIKDNSVDVLVAHHCLEHIDMSEVLGTSREWYRVLKPGGRLAVSVPDAKAIAKRWLDGQIDDFTFNVNMYGAYQGHQTDLHRWSYSANYLIDMMTGKGVVPWKWRNFTFNELNVPLYKGADFAFDWWILALEFIKK